MHFQNSNFRFKIKRLVNPTKTYEQNILRPQNCRCKFIKTLLTKKAKETCKPNNRDLNRD